MGISSKIKPELPANRKDPVLPESTLPNINRRVRSVSPLGMRVVIRIRKAPDTTDTGLYLPEGAKHATQESLIGEVLEVASAVDRDTNEEANISGIPLGATVLIPKQAGVTVPWDDQLRIVETKEVLAIIEEISVT